MSGIIEGDNPAGGSFVTGESLMGSMVPPESGYSRGGRYRKAVAKNIKKMRGGKKGKSEAKQYRKVGRELIQKKR